MYNEPIGVDLRTGSDLGTKNSVFPRNIIINTLARQLKTKGYSPYIML